MCKYFLAYYVLCFAISVSPLLSEESTKYNLLIKERAVLDKLDDAGVNVFSKSGQKFSCSWGTDSGIKPDNATSQLSSSVVHSLLSMFSAFDCLRVKKGWWTYEFCFRKYVAQYHDESKETSKTFLGLFESEFDWDNSSEKPKYHSQFYSNGSICDLTNMPRITEVQFVCADSRTFHILSVEEPESCVYLLKISTPSLCGNSHFASQFSTKPHDITCHPTLSGPDYYRYDALNKARDPILQSSLANMSQTFSLPSKRLYTNKNMYNKIRNNRRRRKLKLLRRSTGMFLRSLKRLSVLYKKQNLKSSWSSHPISLLPTNPAGLYKLWLHIGSLSSDLSNFTSVLLRRNEISHRHVPLDIVKVAIIVTKSVIMEVEDYRQLLNTFLTAPMQTVGMMHLFNLSDVHESISRIWRELFSCTDPNEAHTMLSTVIHVYKKHNLDIPTVEDIPLTRLPTESRNNAKSAYLKYKLDFTFSSNRDNNIEILQYNGKVLDNPLSYEEYSKLFDVIKKVVDLTDLFLETSKLYVKILFFLHKKIELSQNIETRLKQTFSNILTDSNVNVVVIQGGNRIMKDKYNQDAADQWDRDLLPSLKQREIIEIMQKVVTNLDPEISDEVDIVEKTENQGGLSTYYIMPGGPRKKEEKRVRKLEQNYHFTFH
ncbi:unnamed protein product [Schistosoma mattheei]|uniref:MRH domain-containing protein n=3 Tax=Schistosoma mattheei TaxID=31246 RepID=A0AA85BVS4_9TREM|nr:unnamed protein product [Schistosoma mattheei]